MDPAGEAPVGPEIDAAYKKRVARREQLLGLGARTWKTSLLPDLVEAARVAAVAGDEVAAAYPEPARNPNVDRVRLGERTPLRNARARHV